MRLSERRSRVENIKKTESVHLYHYNFDPVFSINITGFDPNKGLDQVLNLIFHQVTNLVSYFARKVDL